MKLLRRLTILTILGFCTVIAQAQQVNSSHGLVLNQSTIEDTISLLGQPQELKENQKLKTPIDAWLDKSARYTKLEFKKQSDLRRLKLFFLKGKLCVIKLELNRKKKINPNSLSRVYGIVFVPKLSRVDLAISPAGYERQAGNIYPITYPTNYALVGIAKHTYVVAAVDNVGWFSALRELAEIPDDPMSFPGKVWLIQLISRTLTDTRGLEALQ